MISWWAGALLLPLLACSGPPNPVEIADRAAVSGRWDVAYEQLLLAGNAAEVIGRRAEAALQAGNLRGASVDFLRLGQTDPGRRGEAAAGLGRTATLAARRGEPLALTTAILGLRELAPNWPVGRVGLSLRLGPAAPADEVVLLTPAILAGSPSNEMAEAGILRYATALRTTAGCFRAVPVLEALLERVEGASRVAATTARSGCQLEAALSSLAEGDTLAARRALDATVAMDPAGVAGRRALIALGDLYLSDGEPFAARVAWQTAAAAATGSDTITALAFERLRGTPEPPVNGEPDSP